MAKIAAHARQYLIFTLGATRFGLPIETVAEVVVPRELTVLPRAPQFLKGLMRLREQVVPVIDLRERFGIDASLPGRLLVVKSPALIAYHVDSVDEVVECGETELQAAPAAVAAFIPEAFMSGVFGRAGGFIIALKPEMLLTREESGALAATARAAG